MLLWQDIPVIYGAKYSKRWLRQGGWRRLVVGGVDDQIVEKPKKQSK